MWRDVLVEEDVPAARLRLALASVFRVATTDVEIVSTLERAHGSKVVCVQTAKPGGFEVLLTIFTLRGAGADPVADAVALGRELGQRLLTNAPARGQQLGPTERTGGDPQGPVAQMDPHTMLLVDQGELSWVRLDAEALEDGAYRIARELTEPW